MIKLRLKAALCVALLSAATAEAQTPMTADEFDAYTQGRTLFFATEGQRYGAETYLRNRRVRWSFLDGQCQNGHWYAELDQICFLYEDAPGPACWQFFEGADGLTAQFTGPGEDNLLYEIEGGDEEMLCLGPEIGA